LLGPPNKLEKIINLTSLCSLPNDGRKATTSWWQSHHDLLKVIVQNANLVEKHILRFVCKKLYDFIHYILYYSSGFDSGKNLPSSWPLASDSPPLAKLFGKTLLDTCFLAADGGHFEALHSTLAHNPREAARTILKSTREAYKRK
jgi:hypothetical protein